MRQWNYLNVILTVNAVLLAGLLWTQIAATPILDRTATAQVRKSGPPVPTIPNAGKQRQSIIDALQDLSRSVEATQRMLESGAVRVQVTNLDEISLD